MGGETRGQGITGQDQSTEGLAEQAKESGLCRRDFREPLKGSETGMRTATSLMRFNLPLLENNLCNPLLMGEYTQYPEAGGGPLPSCPSCCPGCGFLIGVEAVHLRPTPESLVAWELWLET